MRPYIGVTGITQLHQMHALGKLFPPESGYMGPVLMAGILVSKKTLRGGPARLPERSPLARDLRSLLNGKRDGHVRPFIHYHTRSIDEELLLEMMALVGHAPRICGIQLNVLWPSPEVLAEFQLRTGHEYEIILQMSYLALYPDAIGKNTHHEVSANFQRILDYGPSIDAVLFDPSGGRGELLTTEDLELIQLYLKRFEGRRYIVGIAGGLSADTLEVVTDLIKEHPKLSIDAEGRLRDEEDKLDMMKAIRYVEKALELRGFATTQT